MNENLRKDINHFIVYANKTGLFDEDLSDMVVCLKKVEDGVYDIVAMHSDSSELSEYDVRLPFPELPKDRTEAMIDLAGFLSVKLSAFVNGSEGAKKYSNSLTKDERKERARKAAEARWGKDSRS